MSANLYNVRVYWDPHRMPGLAKKDGVSITLTEQPPHGIPHVIEIDYAPEVRCAQVRESADKWRDMSSAEMIWFDKWLTSIVDAVRKLGAR